MSTFTKEIGKYLGKLGLATFILGMTSGVSNYYAQASAVHFYNQGIEAHNAENLHEAEYQLKISLDKNPNMSAAHLALGAVHLKNDRLDEGVRSLLLALETLPYDESWGGRFRTIRSMAYNNLGVAELLMGDEAFKKAKYVDAFQRWTLATAYYNNALEIDHYNSLPRKNLRITGIVVDRARSKSQIP